MTVLLIPVDPDHPAHTRVAVERAAALCAAAPQAVHLLSVQPPVSAHVGQFFAPGELHAFHEEAGQEELAPVGAQLSAAGVPFTAHVRVGRRAETIARLAGELHCDTIVMGPDEPAGLTGRLFGTVAEQVRHALGGSEPVRVLGA